jgi:hypothetical protein
MTRDDIKTLLVEHPDLDRQFDQGVFALVNNLSTFGLNDKELVALTDTAITKFPFYIRPEGVGQKMVDAARAMRSVCYALSVTFISGTRHALHVPKSIHIAPVAGCWHPKMKMSIEQIDETVQRRWDITLEAFYYLAGSQVGQQIASNAILMSREVLDEKPCCPFHADSQRHCNDRVRIGAAVILHVFVEYDDLAERTMYELAKRLHDAKPVDPAYRRSLQ